MKRVALGALAFVTAGLAVRAALLLAGVVFRMASGPVAGVVIGVALVVFGLTGLLRPRPEPAPVPVGPFARRVERAPRRTRDVSRARAA